MTEKEQLLMKLKELQRMKRTATIVLKIANSRRTVVHSTTRLQEAIEYYDQAYNEQLYLRVNDSVRILEVSSS